MGKTFRRNDRWKKDRRDRNFKESKKFKDFKHGNHHSKDELLPVKEDEKEQFDFDDVSEN